MDLDDEDYKAKESQLSHRGEDEEEDGDEDESMQTFESEDRTKRHEAAQDDSGVVTSGAPLLASIPLPHRSTIKRKAGRRPPFGTPHGHAKIGLRDVAFLFDLSPHISVEPMGQSAMERMLAAEYDDSYAQDENAGPMSLDQPGLGEEERLALAARLSAFSKHTGFEASQHEPERLLSSLPSKSRSRGRQDFLINQQGPWSLLLERGILAERQRGDGKAQDGKSGDAATSTAATTKKVRGAQDPLSDVVDPVKLLAGLCD